MPGRSGQQRNKGKNAFTLLEILAAITIISILLLLIAPNYQTLVAKAQETICASNMRSIRLALGNYLDDHQSVWPQAPESDDEKEISAFWLAALAPYDISERTWRCPTLASLMKSGNKKEDFIIHYVPTSFDATPNIANRWATQPWLIEIGDAHGKGPLICFPDGSVKPLTKVLAEQGLL